MARSDRILIDLSDFEDELNKFRKAEKCRTQVETIRRVLNLGFKTWESLNEESI